MRDVSPDLTSYVPPLLVRQLAAEPPGRPADDVRLDGVVMIADVIGFTGLTDHLSKRGPSGAELLSQILNDHYADLIADVADAGGEVLHFSGDALVAAWSGAAADADAGSRVRRAGACALAIQHRVERRPPVEGVQLRVRLGIAAGTLVGSQLGGVRDRWLFLIAGAPIKRAAAAAALAAPGTVCVDASAWSALAGAADGVPLGADAYWLRGLSPSAPRGTPAAVAVLQSEASAASVPGLERFVAEELRSLADARTPGTWLAEFRRISVAFISLRDLGTESAHDAAQLPRATRIVQEAIDRYEGSINQFVADETGLTFICAWGVPLHTHENDAVRAVDAAVDICDGLRAIGIRASAGLCTGPAFCGIRGSAVRREYSLLGVVMNRAARLMQATASGMCCDAETMRAAAGRIAFEELPHVRVKGYEHPLAAFYPIRRGIDRSETSLRALMGRESERDRIDAGIAGVRRGADRVLVLEGEPGIGKSRLLQYAAGGAAREGFRCFLGAADAIEHATSYFVWRPVVAQLLGVPIEGDESAGPRLAKQFDTDGLLRDHGSLLNAVLPLGLQGTDATAGLDSVGRAERLREVIVRLLAGEARVQPIAILFDDAQWFDSASWALLIAVARAVSPALVGVTSRPVEPSLAVPMDQLLAVGGQRIVVPPLDADDSLELIRDRLHVRDISGPVASFINDKAEGNPFFSEQLAYALRDAGAVVLEGGSCRIASHLSGLQALGLPSTVQGIITGRVDRLPAAEQMMLKAASVIGRQFSLQVLSDVVPAETSLPEQLEHLTTLNLLVVTTAEPLTYAFKHVLTQDVVYESMAFARRRDLHRGVAEWYERHSTDDLRQQLSLLAHHWSAAGDSTRASPYLERATEQALANHANEEAVGFATRALAAADGGTVRVAPARRSRWEYYLAEALLRLSRYGDSESHFLESLRLVGRPFPATPTSRVLAVFADIGRQALIRSGLRVVRTSDPTHREEQRLAANVHQRLSEVGYWKNDFWLLISGTLRSLNAAEEVGESRELVVAFAIARFAFGLSTLHRVSDVYRRLGEHTDRQVGNLEASAFRSELEAVYFQANGRWADSHTAAETAASLFERLGDRFRWQTCVCLRGYAFLHQGELDRATDFLNEGRRIAGENAAVQALVWTSAGSLACELLRDGQGSIHRAVEINRLLARGVDHSDAIMCHGLLAWTAHRRGDHATATRHVESAQPLIDRFPPASFHTLLGSWMVTEIHMDRFEQRRTDAGYLAARNALRSLRRFARACPIGRPRAALSAGRWLALTGRRSRATRAYERAAAEAARLGMSYDEGLAWRALAEMADSGAARDERLARARARLLPAGALWCLEDAFDA